MLDPKIQEAFEEELSSVSDADGQVVFRNQCVSDMINQINQKYPDYYFTVPKAVKGNYDFIIDTSSREAIKKSLASYGLGISEKVLSSNFYTSCSR